jgi:hypothetical protein
MYVCLLAIYLVCVFFSTTLHYWCVFCVCEREKGGMVNGGGKGTDVTYIKIDLHKELQNGLLT